MKKTLRLSASLEDYIEAIYHIIEEKQGARGKDIATRLGVSGPSVTEALRTLSKKGLINYAPYEVITITAKGREIAEDVIRRHNALKRFFVQVLAVDEDTAEDGACKIEHIAPSLIISRMVNFIKFQEKCPKAGKDLTKAFADFCARNDSRNTCADECRAQCPGNNEPF